MVRKTETRALVAEMASRLAKKGQTPSIKLVRDALGGGSPNVIAEELRRWREQQSKPAAPTGSSPVSLQEPGEQFSPVQLLEALHLVRDLVRSQRSAEAEASSAREELVGTASLIADGLRSMQAMVASLESDRKATAERLERIEARYEGIRKHMLLAVDEAREEARMWKERAAQLQGEASTWRTAAHQRPEPPAPVLAPLRASNHAPEAPGLPALASSTRPPPDSSLPLAPRQSRLSPVSDPDYSE